MPCEEWNYVAASQITTRSSERGLKQFPASTAKGSMAQSTPRSRLLPSGTVTQYISGVLSHSVVMFCYSNPRHLKQP